MSLDPGDLTRSSSPSGSEASQPKSRAQAVDQIHIKDKNYRRYAASVDRALSLFDTALQEWADYISFLSRLLKALQSHPPSLPIIPSKTIVARRLAQCLNPSLPSGVHQKALEVYGYIFSILEPDRLSRDLALYLPGIAPTLSFASLTVRPLFLSLVEAYIVDLDPSALRPALKSIILALLPGLEEETSEDFEAAIRIVNKFRTINLREDSLSDSNDDTSSQYFWQCLFLASITNPSRRLGVLAYLNRYLPKLGGTSPWLIDSESGKADRGSSLLSIADSIIMPEPGLLIRCFATGLADDQLLVQRNFLDLLVTHLPLHSPVLQNRATPNDLEILVAAAAGVVTRRDMSLNRRLWSWFLGPETSNGAQELSLGEAEPQLSSGHEASRVFDYENAKFQYFTRFGLKPLVQSIKTMINRNSLHPPERAKPLKISLSLMDRWEVGELVVPAIFLPVMRSVQQYEQLASSTSNFEEVFRSASAFFDGVESSLIFSELLSLVHVDPSGIQTRSGRAIKDLKLANFIISRFNLGEEEILISHIPLLLLALLVKMRVISSNTEGGFDHQNIQSAALNETSLIVKHLLELIPERVFYDGIVIDPTRHDQPLGEFPDIASPEIIKSIIGFYKTIKANLKLPPLPFSYRDIGELLLREAQFLVLAELESENPSHLKERVNIFLSLLNKIRKSQIVKNGRLFSTMYHKLLSKSTEKLPFVMISSMCSIVTTLYSIHVPGFYISYQQVSDIIPPLVQKLWAFLSPLSPKFHVESVRCLWLLHSVTWQNHLVEASIASIMVGAEGFNSSHLTTIEETEKFVVLWNHSQQISVDPSTLRSITDYHSHSGGLRDPKSIYQSSMLDRPLFLVLDLLSGVVSEASLVVKEWISDLSSLYKVFDIIISKLTDLSYFMASDLEDTSQYRHPTEHGEANQCRYLFETASGVISSLSRMGWSILMTNTVAGLDKCRKSSDTDDDSQRLSIQATLIRLSIQALSSCITATREPHSEEERMQLAAFTVMRQLLSGPGAGQLVEMELDNFLIDQLFFSLDHKRSSLQPVMIDTLLAALKIRFTPGSLEPHVPSSVTRRKASLDALSNISRISLTGEKSEKELRGGVAPLPSPQLLQCLLKGLSSTSSQNAVQKWVKLLVECLPLYSGTIFQILLTLVECLCQRIIASYNELQLLFKQSDGSIGERSEYVTMALLGGLENCIAVAHERLILEEESVSPVKSPDQPQGFFGNMVSETLVQLWHDAVTADDTAGARSVFNLLHTLDGSRPKVTIPAIFNSIYSRTDPTALEPSRKSLDDDVLDEIWADCTTFLRDVLANPFPHRHILPRLMEFGAVLGEKMDRTNFGDDRRARKDLGDLLLRLLTAILTSKPLGSSQEPIAASRQLADSERASRPSSKGQQLIGPDDTVGILASVMPALVTTLGESDRISTAMSNISANIIAPLFHSRLFPQNVNKSILDLLQQMSKIPGASKYWRKDMGDAFNDTKFFTTKVGLVQTHWLDLIHHWVLTDKDRLPDVYSRLSTPTSAGIMFGVGAAAARLEADRKAQLNLRRVALFILAADEDHFATELANVHQKLEDLLMATHISSPSSVTRAEVYMVLRALVLKTSTIHLAPFWPIVNRELQDAISAIGPGQQVETYNPYSLLQACKLLETLLLIAPDEFQLQEWLFVTDTIDAVYPPDQWESVALADSIAQSLGTTTRRDSFDRSTSNGLGNGNGNDGDDNSRRQGYKNAWLNSELSRETAKDEIVDKVLKPFFDRLSIYAFESTYSLGAPDLKCFKDDLLADLFNEFTMAN
ncbi:protein dopey [Histoplasma mississippiense (nom. inval.)]|uniref:protein dopey n=1 Tax=Ajellomyces capsulatus (strain NAm1 / WU24) TaxID=2059318 RepID=UPI000157C22B|nr:protein dopey [Histoplasma mississippiense (nom. inval.)]EDN07194.1 protein dopey [Histoplasma mississippiense (nom. inval.)]